MKAMALKEPGLIDSSPLELPKSRRLSPRRGRFAFAFWFAHSAEPISTSWRETFRPIGRTSFPDIRWSEQSTAWEKA